MLQIHPNARTTPATRAEIARSSEPSGMLARRYGVSAETIRKWRKRGPEDVPVHLPGHASSGMARCCRPLRARARRSVM